MPDEIVIDASVAAKLFIEEEGSEAARAILDLPMSFVAPDLIFAELASVAAKRVRRGEISVGLAEQMMGEAPHLFGEIWSNARLMEGAFHLATAHGVSAYDASYLALAQACSTSVITADAKLAAKARAAGLGDLVRLL